MSRTFDPRLGATSPPHSLAKEPSMDLTHHQQGVRNRSKLSGEAQQNPSILSEPMIG